MEFVIIDFIRRDGLSLAIMAIVRYRSFRVWRKYKRDSQDFLHMFIS